MYRSEPDPYCYPGTNVLINRLDIRDQSSLDAFEISMGSNTFCYPAHIERELATLFERLAADDDLRHLDRRQFANKAAAFIAETERDTPLPRR